MVKVHGAHHFEFFYIQNVLEKEKRDIIYSVKFREKITDFLRVAELVKKELETIKQRSVNEADPVKKQRALDQLAVITAYQTRIPANRFTELYFTNLEAYSAIIDSVINRVKA